jgi:hypothetical protein
MAGPNTPQPPLQPMPTQQPPMTPQPPMMQPPLQQRPRMQQPPRQQSSSKLKPVLIAVAVVGVLIALIFAFSGNDVSTVKHGHFHAAQNISVGDAFEKFFANPKWTSKVSNGKHYVYFEGEAGNTKDKSKTKKFKATFHVDPKKGTFEMIHSEIDGHDITGSQSKFIPQICAGSQEFEYEYQR